MTKRQRAVTANQREQFDDLIRKSVQRQKLIDELLRSGAMCANCCFNLGQENAPNHLTERSKQSMRESQKAWDTASAAWHQAQARKL